MPTIEAGKNTLGLRLNRLSIKKMSNMPFSLEMKVRDYECDMQGIVNNAVYQNYLEHARHEYLLSRGTSFADLTARGIIIVVVRAELDYRQSLKSGDSFSVSVAASRPSKVKLVFHQQIQRLPDQVKVLDASITTTAVKPNNRPYFPAELEPLLDGEEG